MFHFWSQGVQRQPVPISREHLLRRLQTPASSRTRTLSPPSPRVAISFETRGESPMFSSDSHDRSPNSTSAQPTKKRRGGGVTEARAHAQRAKLETQAQTRSQQAEAHTRSAGRTRKMPTQEEL